MGAHQIPGDEPSLGRAWPLASLVRAEALIAELEAPDEESPDFRPPGLDLLAERGFERRNRRADARIKTLEAEWPA